VASAGVEHGCTDAGPQRLAVTARTARDAMSTGPSAAVLLAAMIVAAAVLAGCSDRPAEQPADLVLLGGTVYTAGAGADLASAVAVRDGRITYVGDDAGAEALAGPDTRVVELAGRMVAPGFHDSHMHPMSGGLRFASVSPRRARVA
jgi:hypothetical protein